MKIDTPRLGAAIGAAILIACTTWLAATWGDRTGPNRIDDLAMHGIVVGIAGLLWAGLKRQGTDIDAAYQLGYDIGYEAGHRVGVTEAPTRKVVVDLTERRRAGGVRIG